MQRPSGWLLCLALLAAPLGASAELATLPNGDRYQGEVTDGVLNGPVVYLWADGDRYEGTFLNALPHGEGTYTWADGRQYVGDFLQGKRQGQGELSWPNGDRFAGRFVNNERQGPGEMKWHTGERYLGQFAAGAMHGQGEYIWPNGNRYIGTFVLDQRSGAGIFLWTDGSSWSGVFLEGEPSGLGIERQTSGAITLQRREFGQLLEQTPVADNPRCRSLESTSTWMVQADGCVNGLAHGNGIAASLNGEKLVVNGRWVLGVLVDGAVQNLPTPPAVAAERDVVRQVDG
jgi:hypothetical protein